MEPTVSGLSMASAASMRFTLSGEAVAPPALSALSALSRSSPRAVRPWFSEEKGLGKSLKNSETRVRKSEAGERRERSGASMAVWANGKAELPSDEGSFYSFR